MMMRKTRREFLEASGTLAASMAAASRAAGSPSALPPPGESAGPDLVLVNAKVYTVDDEMPTAEAFAVKNGRFVAVGSSSDVHNLATPKTEIIDATGMTVTPGFIDTHSHPSGAGVSELVNVNCDLKSIAAIQAAIKKRVQTTAPGGWVVGFKYDDTKLAEGRPINKKDLDEVAPENPVVVGHRGGHTGVYNTKAFALAGITPETPDPRGGKFYREDGELTGLVPSALARSSAISSRAAALASSGRRESSSSPSS